MQEMWVQSLGQEDPLEKEMATHSSILAWEIPRTEEPGRLQSMGLQRVRHCAAHAVQHSGCSSVYLQTLTFTPRAAPSSRGPDLLRVSPGCLQALPTQPKPNSSSAALPPRCWGSVKAAPPTSCQATHLGISFHGSLCVHPSLFSLQVKCCLVDLGNLLFVLTAAS